MDLLNNYREWILSQNACWYTIDQTDEGNFIIKIKNGFAEVNFYAFEATTCELKITNKNDDNVFYLHFELKEMEHAQNLFEEMIESLKKLKDEREIEAMLCCSSGLTTSFFAEKLNETAQLLSLDFHFTADSYTELYRAAQDKDVILLAPQIGYMYDKVKEVLTDKLVIKVPGAVFGTYDAAGMIELVRDELSQRKDKKEDISQSTTYEPQDSDYGIYLVISSEGSLMQEISNYRIYNECELIEQGQVKKLSFNLSDYEDIIDTALIRHPEIEKIFISNQGNFEDGHISYAYFGIEDESIVEAYEAKYQRPVVFVNSYKANARGYLEEHKDDCKNAIVFHIPMLGHSGGAGIIMDGKLLQGHHNLAGEIHYMTKAIHYTDPYRDLRNTPEGQAELTGKEILPLILAMAPETVVIDNDMITDIEDVKKWVTKYLPASLQPDFILDKNHLENVLWGTTLLGLEELSNR